MNTNQSYKQSQSSHTLTSIIDDSSNSCLTFRGIEIKKLHNFIMEIQKDNPQDKPSQINKELPEKFEINQNEQIKTFKKSEEGKDKNSIRTKFQHKKNSDCLQSIQKRFLQDEMIPQVKSTKMCQFESSQIKFYKRKSRSNDIIYLHDTKKVQYKQFQVFLDANIFSNCHILNKKLSDPEESNSDKSEDDDVQSEVQLIDEALCSGIDDIMQGIQLNHLSQKKQKLIN